MTEQESKPIYSPLGKALKKQTEKNRKAMLKGNKRKGRAW